MLSESASVKWHLACGRGSVSVSFIPLLSGENRRHPESFFTPVACISYNKALSILHWGCLALFGGNRYRREQLWIGTRDVCISAGLYFAHGNMTTEFVAPQTVPPGSSVHGILQARILEQVASSYPRGSSQSRGWTHVSCVSCIGRWVLYYLYHLRSPHEKSVGS